jgi:hypothetical protein
MLNRLQVIDMARSQTLQEFAVLAGQLVLLSRRVVEHGRQRATGVSEQYTGRICSILTNRIVAYTQNLGSMCAT